MKIVCWNVRGLESWRKRIIIKEFLKRVGPEIVVLKEMKMEVIDRRIVKSV